ncbi:hypothetical protein GCM10009753_74140 [Streptantibioticus ferralitis]
MAIHFRRLTRANDLVLYLFGTPGQRRFHLLWEDIAQGALGALAMVDTRRLEGSFEVMDFVEEAEQQHAVAINTSPEAPTYDLDTLRDHFDLHPDTPLHLVENPRRWQVAIPHRTHQCCRCWPGAATCGAMVWMVRVLVRPKRCGVWPRRKPFPRIGGGRNYG